MAMRTSKTKFSVLSPDGIPIQQYPFLSKEAAEAGAKSWLERFKSQGFYSSASLGRIPLEEIPKYLVIEPCRAPCLSSANSRTRAIEYIGVEGSLRLALPTVVSEVIARQRDALTSKSSSTAAKANALDRKARGIEPGLFRNVTSPSFSVAVNENLLSSQRLKKTAIRPSFLLTIVVASSKSPDDQSEFL